jgi:hypothetical protein
MDLAEIMAMSFAGVLASVSFLLIAAAVLAMWLLGGKP